MSIVKDIRVVRKLGFPLDHRAIHLKLIIPKRCKIRKVIKFKEKLERMIPDDKVQKAKRELKDSLSRWEEIVLRHAGIIQQNHDHLGRDN